MMIVTASLALIILRQISKCLWNDHNFSRFAGSNEVGLNVHTGNFFRRPLESTPVLPQIYDM